MCRFVPAKPYTAPAYYPGVPLHDHTAQVLSLQGFFQVRPYTCGFASTLTVLRYFRRYVPERELYERLGTDSEGTSQTAIIRELRREGLSVSIRYNMDFSRICQAIDSNRLVVGYHHRLEHWVVIHGYARDPDRIFVADSYPGYRREHTWEYYGVKMHGFGIVCGSSRHARQRHRA